MISGYAGKARRRCDVSGCCPAGRVVWGIDVRPFLGVPFGPSLFFDARNLTAVWECHRLAYDIRLPRSWWRHVASLRGSGAYVVSAVNGR